MSSQNLSTLVGLLALALSSAATAATLGATNDSFTWREGAIIRGSVTEPRLALVFTGHEYANSAPAILDTLRRRKIKAAFFLTGDFLTNRAFHPHVRRILADGHCLGPHSDRHLLYAAWEPGHRTLVDRATFRADLRRNVDKIVQLGAPRPRLFLPPFEHYNAEIAAWTAAEGLQLINHTPGTRSAADYTESDAPNHVSTSAIFDSILRRADQTNGLNGFLLLLHIGASPRRTDPFHMRLDELLGELTRRGYTFARVDELLGRPEESAPRLWVRLNQAGYRPRDPKSAVLFGEDSLPARFQVEEAETGKVVYRGRTQRMADARWGRFTHHARLDFTAFRQPGQYLLRAGDAVSPSFGIGDGVLFDLADASLEFMRQQRCGYNPWLGAECHQSDGRTAYGPLPEGSPVDARGGWHDAGDLLKYQLTSGNATAQLLLAYALASPAARARFTDRAQANGDAGPNGVPDVLDEARWGLEWLLKLHPAPDQFYHQVADDRDHTALRLPQNDRVDYGWGPGGARTVYAADGRPQGLGRYQSESTGLANLAGRYAAAMALAWQVWKDDPQERDFAARCLAAGESIYTWGRRLEGVQQGNSHRSPYRYAEITWADDMEWGAAELYRATGRPEFLADARRYATLAAAESWMGRTNAGHYEFYPFLNAGHFRLYDLVDRSFQRQLAAWYRTGLEQCRTAGRGNPYDAGVPFIWCSANLTVALATQAAFYERMTGDRRFAAFAAAQRDWLLGRNPWGSSLITEVGTVFPTQVHLQTTKLTGRSVSGGLVDGPVYERIFKSLRGVSITEPDPFAAFQDARAVYHDDYHDYSTNEPTMDGTASLILLWALCEPSGGPHNR